MSSTESVTGSSAAAPDKAAAPVNRDWNWMPPVPIENSPLFAWPPDPVKVAKWLVATWNPLSVRAMLAALAILTWFTLQPALERCVTLEAGWIAQIYFRNLALMLLVVGGLHLYFYGFKKQGMERKYDPRDLARDSNRFSWRHQVWDNMFWSLASGVTLWTAYEVLFMWAYANGYAPYVSWNDNPVWFVLMFLLIPILSSFHFYWIHWFLHWKPLYRIAHAVHHRNVNVGPWSGLSMHPIEHVLYLSAILVHFVLASHPIHILFHMYWLTLGAATSHTGFEGLLLKNSRSLALGYFHHQLHHRYFECNYGNADVPWDQWFGSFHDGTPEGMQRIRQKRRFQNK